MADKYLRKFKRSLPMSLLRAREAVMKNFIPSLQEHKLSAQQWRVIRALQDENGLDISKLSVRCHLMMPSLSRIIKNLESRSLIDRRANDRDQRVSVIFLTKSGKQLYDLVAPKSVERYEDITEKFGYGKMELLYELLEELVEKVDEADE
ncbi:MAG: homoprotocatechuate degradation operon regulator HpaR [Porticoccaceae bacterium]|jgi:homoprotocatechuate degradation regulator HpaR|nr:homoprotocatechuate degradation operon regulator HpaR [Porticoccaceae bacterium]MBT7541124.1 homoprotocatechuate degradation operon regulator HpaR [Gammaproteobacteria bacterium]MDE0929382.1 homoprotocatechuate degradation operon regulator HpaR [Halioglobus sp.]MBT3797726.1 homoprotocatechuate degradation operon regulator HpaR [Porticoccaceae bacterium]MBT4163669.1 homoprotocatechuate degradation operon regulator HpaR [Porticoccaceae bacterium]|tara:strand:+ start:155 stop:604 length:450 start_codon:yes stop_codon:yes gene_type:complete